MNCLAKAACDLVGADASDLYRFCGHDGTESWWEGNCRPERGFHIQEIQDYLFTTHDLHLVKIEQYPQSLPGQIDSICEQRQLWSDDTCERRFLGYLHMREGILIGETQSGIPHAVHWTGTHIIDSIVGPSLNDFSVREAYIGIKSI